MGEDAEDEMLGVLQGLGVVFSTHSEFQRYNRHMPASAACPEVCLKLERRGKLVLAVSSAGCPGFSGFRKSPGAVEQSSHRSVEMM